MKTFIPIAAFILTAASVAWECPNVDCETFVAKPDACVTDEFCVHVCELSPRCFEVCDCVTSSSSTTTSTTSPITSTTSTSTSPITSSTTTSTTTSATSTSTSTTSSQISTTQTDLEGEQVRICYFQNWVQWIFPMMNDENIFRQDIEYDPTLCTHIHYGFGAIEDGTYAAKMYDVWADVDGFAALRELKARNPQVKLLWSTGGWMWNDCSEWGLPTTGAYTCHIFSEMVASEENSRKHARSVIAFLREHGFDGYDVDWEWPGYAGRNGLDMQERPQDKQNFINFLRIVREEFDADANAGNPRLSLTAAVGVGAKVVEIGYDVAQMNQYLDLIGLMTYDLHGYWDGMTGHNTPMTATPEDIQAYSGENGPGDHLTLSWVVDSWISQGADPNKLVLGLGTYGRGFTLATPGFDQGPLSPITTQQFQGKQGASRPGPVSDEAGYLAYFEIVDMLEQGGVYYWDEARSCPYMISADGTQWVSYDNEQSLQIKLDFLKEKKLRGAMVWALELDDWRQSEWPLLNTIKNGLAGYREGEEYTTTSTWTISSTMDPNPSSTSSTTVSTTTTGGACQDLPLQGAYGANGAYTCDSYGRTYCNIAQFQDSCCYCGGGSGNSGVCTTFEAISPQASDAWCQHNCMVDSEGCPTHSALCACAEN